MLRAVGAGAAGLLVTLLLFALMRWLVASGEVALQDELHATRIQITMDERELDVRRRERSRPERAAVVPPPPALQALAPERSAAALDGVRLELDSAIEPISFKSTAGVTLDRGAYPKFRVQHRFPRRAEDRGLAGCVRYSFTITRSGSTSDISVLESSSSLFESAGRNAIEQYRYEPLIVDGEPRESPDQKVLLIWELEGEPKPDHPACLEE